MKRILIVEDDEAIARIERDFLEIEGYQVTWESDGARGLATALSREFDLILLDVMLPGMDGFELCRKMRAKLAIPLIMVTARHEDTDKIRGLGLGADDYIAKPFSPTEMVARVKANLAQYERLLDGGATLRERNDVLEVGDITLNRGTRRVFVSGSEVELKNREYELLAFLMANPDIVFSKEHLYERVWGMEAYGDLKTVAVHVNRLRDKLEKDPANPRHIETVWGAGYRFKI